MPKTNGKASPKGARRAAFRKSIETRLTAMGYSRTQYAWQDGPARLLVIVRGEFRTFWINAGVSIADREYELGKLAAFAEVMDLVPKLPKTKPAPPSQVDLEELIGAGPVPNFENVKVVHGAA